MNSLFFMGVLAGLTLSFPTGPNGSLCLYRSVQFGWPQGLATALGSIAAMSICAVACYLILSLFMEMISAESVENTIAGISGTLSILIGLIFLMTSKPKKVVAMKTSADRMLKMFFFNFSSSFFIGMANPKYIAGFAALLTASSPKLGKDTLTAMHAAVFGCGVFLSATFLCLLNIYVSLTVGKRYLQGALSKLKYWVSMIFIISGVVAIIRAL